MKNRVLSIMILGGLIAAPLAAEVRVSGYFSLDFLKGQSQSPYSAGSFQNVQAGLLLSGNLSSLFTYALEIQSKAEMKFEIEQAWVGFLWSDAVHVKAGLYLVPFGKYNESGRAFQTSLVQAPLPVGEIFPTSWRDVGILIEGKTGLLTYAAYIGNGLAEEESLRAGQQFMDNNRDKGRGARLGLALSQNLEAGLSYYTGKFDAENKRALTLKGVDVTWSDTDFRLSGEYTKAEIENPAPYARGTAEGWFVLCSITVGQFAPFVAYEKFRYEDVFHGAGFAGSFASGSGIFDDRDVWAFGITAAPHQNVILKIEYDINKKNGLELKNNVFRAQAAVHF
ncbi:MAG: porin [Candidatus Aminicenantales bacterium]